MTEAEKYHVLPIDDRTIERTNPALAGRPDVLGDRKSLTLDPQRHVNAVWGADGPTRSFTGYVAEQAGIDPDDVLGADLMTHDLTPSTLSGLGDQFEHRYAAGQRLSAPQAVELALRAGEPVDDGTPGAPRSPLGMLENCSYVQNSGTGRDLPQPRLEKRRPGVQA